MQQIINEVQVQCGGNNIALMQTKVTCEALSDMAFMRHNAVPSRRRPSVGDTGLPVLYASSTHQEHIGAAAQVSRVLLLLCCELHSMPARSTSDAAAVAAAYRSAPVVPAAKLQLSSCTAALGCYRSEIHSYTVPTTSCCSHLRHQRLQ
jgi:hypothetical protein